MKMPSVLKTRGIFFILTVGYNYTNQPNSFVFEGG